MKKSDILLYFWKLMSGLLDTRILTLASAFNLLQYFVLVDEHEVNPNLHRSVVEKEEFREIPKRVLGTSERSSDLTLRTAGLDYPRLSKSQ